MMVSSTFLTLSILLIFKTSSSQSLLQAVRSPASLPYLTKLHTCLYDDRDESIYIFGGFIFNTAGRFMKGVLKFSTVNQVIEEIPNVTFPISTPIWQTIVREEGTDGCFLIVGGGVHKPGLEMCKFCPSDLAVECVNKTLLLSHGVAGFHKGKLYYLGEGRGEGSVHEERHLYEINPGTGVVNPLMKATYYGGPTYSFYKDGSIYVFAGPRVYYKLDLDTMREEYVFLPSLSSWDYVIYDGQNVWGERQGGGIIPFPRGIYKADPDLRNFRFLRVQGYPGNQYGKLATGTVCTCVDTKQRRLYIFGGYYPGPGGYYTDEIWYVDLSPSGSNDTTPSTVFL